MVVVAAVAMGSQVLTQLRQQQLLIQVLSFCEEAKGRKRREGEERRREGEGGGQQEGGREEGKTLKS